jgi:predicted DNA-binding WGR domain protein
MHHVRDIPAQLALPFPAASLRRIDPTQNAARFYSMDVERDLFGRVVIVRRWGRIGTFGKVRLDEHPDEGRALAALVAIEAKKKRCGPASLRSGRVARTRAHAGHSREPIDRFSSRAPRSPGDVRPW